MPAPLIPFLIQLGIVARSEDSQLVNVFHAIGVNSTPTSEDLIDTTTAVGAAVNTFLGVFHDRISFERIHARTFRGPGTLTHDYVFAPGTTGTNSNPPLPDVLALVASLRSIFIGRTNRGRIYTFGATTNDFAANDWTSAYSTDVLDFVAQVQGNLIDEGFALVIGRPTYESFTIVDSVSTDAIVRVQRRREKGSGV